MKTKQLTLSAILIAVALVLSYMERFIPLNLVVPLPGVKLGLANIVTMFALYTMKFRNTAMILLIRCVLGSLFGGSISSLLYSLFGGFLALAVMTTVRRLPFLSVYGVSILGAAAHNVGQIIASMIMLKSVYIISYLPFLLLVSVICGVVTGTITAGTLKGLRASGQAKQYTRSGVHARAYRRTGIGIPDSDL